MRTYEVLFILSPQVPEEEATALITEFRTVGEGTGATLKTEEAWGRRRLAYPIHKFNEGIYHLFVFESDKALSERVTVTRLSPWIAERDTIAQRRTNLLEEDQEALAPEANAVRLYVRPHQIFTLRLIPQVPFFVVNVAMGLTKMRLATFWWVSQLGMLPGTLVFVNAGTQLARIDSLSGVLSDLPSSVASVSLSFHLYVPNSAWAL